LFIVIVIIAILGTMLLPVYAGMRKRAQRVQCIANLRNLYLAADIFLQRNGNWSQIALSTSGNGPQDFANAWIDALAPFGPTRQTWICPAVQEVIAQPRLPSATRCPARLFSDELRR
jgi:type II secretory pathway pseudopilin PulG